MTAMKTLPVFLIASILLVTGCTSVSQDTMMEKKLNGSTMEKTGESMGYIFENGVMMIEDNGKLSAMTQDAVLDNGAIVMTSGIVKYLNGTSVALKEGQSIWPDGKVMEETEVMEKSGATTPTDENTRLANNYYRYDKDAFDEALAGGKVIFLNFRANWCPTCNAERPSILAGMNAVNYSDTVGFEVHYNDDQTQQYDTDMIKLYQVAYQHTKIIIGKDGKVLLKTLEVFDEDRVVSEIEKARTV